MLHGLFIVSLILTCIQLIKESCEPVIPAENWENKELYYRDMENGLSNKELSKNLRNGKYKATETYPEPHRDLNGKIIIENSLLYKQDIKEYGVYQTHEWMRQGKYNLTAEEVKKEEERVRTKIKNMHNLL